MKAGATDPVAELECVAQDAPARAADDQRDESLRRARAAVVAEYRRALEASKAFAATAAAELAPVEREELAAIGALEEVHGRRQAVLQRRDAGLAQLRRDVERTERALCAPAALPAVVLELDDAHHLLVDLAWNHPGLPSWPAAGRAAWLDELGVAGSALAALKLSACAPDEVGRVRVMIDGLAPGRWAAQHADVCRAELVAAGARGF